MNVCTSNVSFQNLRIIYYLKAPHQVEYITTGSKTSSSVSITWKYGKETGVTTFDVKVFDLQDERILMPSTCLGGKTL